MRFAIKNFVMPLIFLGALFFSLFCCSSIPYDTKSFLYAISLSIKELLIFVLPVVIFSLVFNSIKNLGSKAFKYVSIIVFLVCCSNFLNTMLSYFISFVGFDLIKNTQSASLNGELFPFFSFEIKKIISNAIALAFGAIFGLVCGLSKNSLIQKVSRKISFWSERFTKYFFKILIPIMPLFIIGSALKLQHEGILADICKNYLPTLLFFLVSSYSFVLLQYFALAKFSFSKAAVYLKNVFPAVVAAFGSMSSAAALPVSIKAAHNNLSNKNNADLIAPATVNVHLVGDCFFIPMVAIAVAYSFGVSTLSFSSYFIFALHFVLAKFAVASVPGGGILVMLPILQQYLGFSSDMLSLVFTIYVLFDPFITACNVAGNGAFAIFFDKFASLIFKTRN